MIRPFALLCAALAVVLTGCASPEGPATRLDKANILPLELDDDYQFRKILTSVFDPNLEEQKTAGGRNGGVIDFERARSTWGAVGGLEVSKRHGSYFTFGSNTAKPAWEIMLWRRSVITRPRAVRTGPHSK